MSDVTTPSKLFVFFEALRKRFGENPCGLRFYHTLFGINIRVVFSKGQDGLCARSLARSRSPPFAMEFVGNLMSEIAIVK